MATITQQLQAINTKLDNLLAGQSQIEADLGVDLDIVVLSASDLNALLAKVEALRKTVGAFKP